MYARKTWGPGTLHTQDSAHATLETLNTPCSEGMYSHPQRSRRDAKVVGKLRTKVGQQGGTPDIPNPVKAKLTRTHPSPPACTHTASCGRTHPAFSAPQRAQYLALHNVGPLRRGRYSFGSDPNGGGFNFGSPTMWSSVLSRAP
jgi:hypothetical protein